MATADDQVTAVILAAGRGTRMRSALPKVLHPVCGTPIVRRVQKSLKAAGISNQILVLGDISKSFEQLINDDRFASVVQQTNRLGTGDAVAACYPAFTEVEKPSFAAGRLIAGSPLSSSFVLITAADTPALSSTVLETFVQKCLEQSAKLAVIGMNQPNPFGYGRLITEKQKLLAIVEEKDASDQERKITLCNSGVVFADTKYLFELLAQIDNSNKQGEYYLTDCFKLAADKNEGAFVFVTDDFESFAGVNNREQLSIIEDHLQKKLKQKWMKEGVSFRLSETTYIDDAVELARDVTVYAGCYLTGTCKIPEGSIIDANVRLHNVEFSKAVHIPAGTVLSDTKDHKSCVEL